jgi:hypothetical protein
MFTILKMFQVETEELDDDIFTVFLNRRAAARYRALGQ